MRPLPPPPCKGTTTSPEYVNYMKFLETRWRKITFEGAGILDIQRQIVKTAGLYERQQVDSFLTHKKLQIYVI